MRHQASQSGLGGTGWEASCRFIDDRNAAASQQMGKLGWIVGFFSSAGSMSTWIFTASTQKVSGVPVILAIEDSVQFYSTYLYVLFEELRYHTGRLLDDDLGFTQRALRQRGIQIKETEAVAHD